MALLKDKVALVTGGSRGIGAAIVETFASEGAKIAFTYLSSEEKAMALVETCKSKGVEAKAYKSDAASWDQAEALVKQVLEDFGSIDVVVNNAGITKDNLLLRMGPDDWDKVIEVNLKSVFNLSKNVLRPMMKQRSGSIINMSSIIGMRGQAGQSNYAASKAGIIGFTKSLAQEMGSRNVRCNAIAPGFIVTDMTHALGEENKQAFLDQIPLKRLGEADEVAKVALFLASDLSSYVSGQVLSVCGALNC